MKVVASLVLMFLSLAACSASRQISEPLIQEMAHGDWKDLGIWPDPSGRVLLVIYADDQKVLHVNLFDLSTAAQRELDSSELKRVSPPEGSIVGAKWSPDGKIVAIEAEGDESGLTFLLNVSENSIQALECEGLSGSVSPQWDRSGESLYFVPYLLNADRREDGLYVYQRASRKIFKMLPGMYLSRGFGVTDEWFVGVRILEGTPALFRVSLAQLREKAEEVARWNSSTGEFIATRSISAH